MTASETRVQTKVLNNASVEQNERTNANITSYTQNYTRAEQTVIMNQS